jgi:hypothetical protein
MAYLPFSSPLPRDAHLLTSADTLRLESLPNGCEFSGAQMP